MASRWRSYFLQQRTYITAFENRPKSRIQHCYVYILSGRQKFLKNDKNGEFGEFLKTWNLLSNSVTRQGNFNRTKKLIKMQHFWRFTNTVRTFNQVFHQSLEKNFKHQISKCHPGRKNLSKFNLTIFLLFKTCPHHTLLILACLYGCPSDYDWRRWSTKWPTRRRHWWDL